MESWKQDDPEGYIELRFDEYVNEMELHIKRWKNFLSIRYYEQRKFYISILQSIC